MAQLSAAVRQNVSNARQANELAPYFRHRPQRGEVVGQVVDTMKHIHEFQKNLRHH